TPTTPSPTPTTSPSPTPTSTAPSGTWTVGQTYQPGDVVTYNGLTYSCRQAHTAISGWEPPNVPALWSQV
ncbi:carbohydrate-binding protein, partial [Micromonospora echinofusca]|nr:cellulose-binding protein [Micromonospora echinofusca]